MHVAKKFAKHPLNFIWQPLLAGFFVVLMLGGLGGFEHISLIGFIGASSIGSSAFLLFSTPSSDSAQLRKIYGAYIICILSAAVFYFILYLLKAQDFQLVAVDEICAALAMSVTMFFMSLFNFEHPPAAGLALGLVIAPWNFYHVAILVLAVLLMTIFKKLLRPWLIDLI